MLNNGTITSRFLNSTDSATRNEILSAIAGHYGITTAEAETEVVGDDAEPLLDYLTGSIRTAVSVLMKRQGLRVAQAPGGFF